MNPLEILKKEIEIQTKRSAPKALLHVLHELKAKLKDNEITLRRKRIYSTAKGIFEQRPVMEAGEALSMIERAAFFEDIYDKYIDIFDKENDINNKIPDVAIISAPTNNEPNNEPNNE